MGALNRIRRYWQVFRGVPGSLLYAAEGYEDVADIIGLSGVPEDRERAQRLRDKAHDLRIEARRIRGY